MTEMHKEAEKYIDFIGDLYHHLRSIIEPDPPKTFRNLRVVYRYEDDRDGKTHEKDFTYGDLNPSEVEKWRARAEEQSSSGNHKRTVR